MKTVILTGLWGSGKTLAARMIHGLGIRMDLDTGGIPEDFEDEAMHFHFTFHPHTLPMLLIHERNAAHPAWGFKHAAAWDNVHPLSIGSVFRNPHVILMHRDAVCLQAETGIDDIEGECAAARRWSKRLACPLMHMSSEVLFRDPAASMLQLRKFLQ